MPASSRHSETATTIRIEAEGLRATKRKRTFEEILDQGIALFRAQGIRRTRTESIARASAVSAATLFNYFPTKAALAEAWVRGESDRILAEAAASARSRGLRPALREACRRLADSLQDAPSLRLEAWRFAGRARDQALEATHPMVVCLREEQVAERVRADLPAEILAELIVDAFEAGLIEGLRPARGGDEPLRRLQARIDVLLDGARKRNERVAAPRA